MENKITEIIEKYHMISNGDKIVVGLSGGADSCALLHFLASVREKYDLTLIACHVNHMIRGEEADHDEYFTRELCCRMNVIYRLLKINVPIEAAKRKEGIEKCARDIRYDFFQQVAQEVDAKIATAHTASDNAETVLLNLTRGSGVNGLCGIPPVRGNIIRPLISVTREEVEQYCCKYHLHYVTDSTNLTDEYTRNKIRHRVIPVLKEVNPSLISNISRMTENLRCEVEYLNKTAEGILKEAQIKSGFPDSNSYYKAEKLYSSGEAIFAQLVFLMLKPFDIIPEAQHIEMVRRICKTSGAVQIKGNIFVVSKQGILRIIQKDTFDNNACIELEKNHNVVINNKKITLKRIGISEFNNAEKNANFLFINSGDCDTIPFRAVFRYRKSGDYFCLPKRNVTKSLKKLFNEMKIPSEQRNRILVLADGNDIIWIEGLGFSAGYQISKKTATVLCLEISDGGIGKEI